MTYWFFYRRICFLIDFVGQDIYFFSMNIRKYNSRKRTNPTQSLINFDDFVKYRCEKEKIITNPFQENWKKAIVLQQMLQLYKPQKENHTTSDTYDRRQFDNFYKHKGNQEQDSIWQNNEQYQWKKMQKMAEGVSNFEQFFQNNKINKTAKKIMLRQKNGTNFKGFVEKKSLQSYMDNKAHNKSNKFNKVYFKKEDFKHFQSLIDVSDKQERHFLIWKREISKLKKKANDQYGVNFAKQQSTPSNQAEFQIYSKKQEQLFKKLIKDKATKEKHIASSEVKQHIEAISAIPIQILISAKRPNTSCSSSPSKSDFLSKKKEPIVNKRYFRIH